MFIIICLFVCFLWRLLNSVLQWGTQTAFSRRAVSGLLTSVAEVSPSCCISPGASPNLIILPCWCWTQGRWKHIGNLLGKQHHGISPPFKDAKRENVAMATGMDGACLLGNPGKSLCQAAHTPQMVAAWATHGCFLPAAGVSPHIHLSPVYRTATDSIFQYKNYLPVLYSTTRCRGHSKI